MNNKKKIIIIICILISVFVIGSVITIILTNTKNDKDIINNEKIDSEISYIDNTLMSIFKNISNENTDFDKCTNEILNLYSNWNSIIIDLNNIQIKNTNLIDFGKRLDDLMISINSKNKIISISNISDLYYLLILYTESYNSNYELKTNISSKYYLIKAYSLIEINNWTLINENITNAEKVYYNYINNIENNRNNNLNSDKLYVSIKELENTITLKNKDLFYLKLRIVFDNF